MANQSQPNGKPLTKLTSAARLLYDQCCSDDPQVRNSAYQQVGEYLLRMAYARLRTRPYLQPLAQEATQQALLTIWQKLQDGRGPLEPQWFLSWCGSIVIHKLLDELRKVGRSGVELMVDETEEGTALMMIPDATVATPERHTIERENTRELIAMIQNHPALKPGQKTVLLNGFFLDQDDSELANLLGVATATVRVLRFRGLRQLRADVEFMARLEQLTFPLPRLSHQRADVMPDRQTRRPKRDVKSHATQLE